MDDELVRLMKGGRGDKSEMEMSICDLTGKVEVKAAGSKVGYALKPLKELYVSKANPPELDPMSKEYMPLFMGIEMEIVETWEEMPGLTDGQVLLGLERLAINPEAEDRGDVLIRHLQIALRLQLSLGDYSRKEVQLALRKIGKSVARHTREGGQRGYLTFIREYLP